MTQKLRVSKVPLEGFYFGKGVRVSQKIWGVGDDTMLTETESALSEEGASNCIVGVGMEVFPVYFSGSVSAITGMRNRGMFRYMWAYWRTPAAILISPMVQSLWGLSQVMRHSEISGRR